MWHRWITKCWVVSLLLLCWILYSLKSTPIKRYRRMTQFSRLSLLIRSGTLRTLGDQPPSMYFLDRRYFSFTCSRVHFQWTLLPFMKIIISRGIEVRWQCTHPNSSPYPGDPYKLSCATSFSEILCNARIICVYHLWKYPLQEGL